MRSANIVGFCLRIRGMMLVVTQLYGFMLIVCCVFCLI